MLDPQPELLLRRALGHAHRLRRQPARAAASAPLQNPRSAARRCAAAGYGDVLAAARPLYRNWRELLLDDCRRGGTFDIAARSNWKHNMDEAMASLFYQNRVPYLFPDIEGSAYLVIDAYGEGDLRPAHDSSLLIYPGTRDESGGPGTDPWRPCVPRFVSVSHPVPPRDGHGHQVCLLGFELPKDENYAMLLGGLHFVYNGSQRLDRNGTDYECVNLIQSKATSPRALVTENLAIATFVPQFSVRTNGRRVEAALRPQGARPRHAGLGSAAVGARALEGGTWGVNPDVVGYDYTE